MLVLISALFSSPETKKRLNKNWPFYLNSTNDMLIIQPSIEIGLRVVIEAIMVLEQNSRIRLYDLHLSLIHI